MCVPRSSSRPGPDSFVSSEPPSSSVISTTMCTSVWKQWRWRELWQVLKMRRENFGHRPPKFAPYLVVLSPQVFKTTTPTPPPVKLFPLSRSMATSGPSSLAMMRSLVAVGDSVPSPSSPTSVPLDPLSVSARKL
jgi:hypothetical protein